MGLLELLRLLIPPLLAASGAAWFDLSSRRRGLQAPELVREGSASLLRRAATFGLLTLVLWLGVTQSLALLGLDLEIDFSRVSTPQLFLTHVVLLAGILGWYGLGFVGGGVPAWADPTEQAQAPQGRARGGGDPSLLAQLGLRAAEPWREVAIGALAGVAGWLLTLAALLVVSLLLLRLGGEEALPAGAPPMVIWIAALPIPVRLAVSLSAGVVEEAFFRGFLQPRVGIAVSTVLFVLAHLSYDQPFMLLGVTLLSLWFAFLVRWRGNILAAIVAHAVFDAIQLLVIIPAILELTGG